MRIAVAADHNGIAYKSRLLALLEEQGHTVDDRGATEADEVVDYPTLAWTSAVRSSTGPPTGAS